MNILMVSSYLPYPLVNGGNIRLFNLIKKLSDKHKITLICEKRDFQTIEDVRVLEKYCKKVITAPRRKQWSLMNIIRTTYSKDAFLVTGHTIDLLKEKILEELANDHFDLIHVETFYVMQNIPETNIPIVLAEHNIEYLVYKRFADRAPFVLRPLLYADIAKLKRNEEQAWKRASRLIAVSEEEKNIMGNNDVTIVPNGVDIEKFTLKKFQRKNRHSFIDHNKPQEKEILFIGDFKWMQNRDSVRWIINDIWPFLLRAVGNEVKLKLHVVGKNIPEDIKAIKKYDGIEFDENAPKETVEIFRKADILLAPIRVAGGTSFKILEAMATGVPVVTTTRGIIGLAAEADKHAIAVDDTQAIVEKTACLLRDEELYNNIAINARKLIEEKYNWEVIVNALDKVYKSALQG
jgi:polysaccharide biosynthesis protein PslH